MVYGLCYIEGILFPINIMILPKIGTGICCMGNILYTRLLYRVRITQYIIIYFSYNTIRYQNIIEELICNIVGYNAGRKML